MRLRTAMAVILLAGAATALYRTLPPRPQVLSDATASLIRGAIHVHSRRSDGSGSVDEIAAAAARAGLKFVILTDHGDGTRTPASPVYRSGVLVVDAAEISAEDGHVVALGLAKTPYPLAGEARDVVEDIARLGGTSIAAHPSSSKSELRWTEWGAPFDGLEWLNGDSEWRDETWGGLVRVLFAYPFRPAESLATMLDRPDILFRRWDTLTARRRIVAVAGSDAHARFDVPHGDTRVGRLALSVPGYESMFRAFSVTLTGAAFTGDPQRDGSVLLDAIRSGHLYSEIDAIAVPAAVSFSAARGGTTWVGGDLVSPESGDIDLRVETNAPPGSRIDLLKNGVVEASVMSGSLRRQVGSARAVYRVEVQIPRAPGKPPVPWVVTNPIYVREGDETAFTRGDPSATTALYEDGAAGQWRVETSPRSKAALDVVRTLSGTELLIRWALGGVSSESPPYAAVAVPAGSAIASYDRVMFRARADKPMRLSVQLRADNGDRWHRSVYLDMDPRPLVVFFDDVRPRGFTTRRRPALDAVRDLLFVVDTVNTKPGTAGQFWIDEVKYGK